MLDDDIAFAGVRGQLAMLATGVVTSRELVELLLERIHRLDPELGAFRVVLADSALVAADAADTARAAGDRRPLLGLPIAVKDDTDVAGVPTAFGAGSPEPAATEDAPIVERLRRAGAVIIGKTNLPELALWGVTSTSWNGTTRNPWDLTRTPGGSSGGSAAAVSAGLVALATGSDGLGSLRIPAAACGLVTLKPTRGLIPQRKAGWNGMSEVGLLARNAADLRLALGCVSDIEPLPLVSGRLRVGWALKSPLPVPLRADPRQAVRATVSALQDLGHQARRVRVRYGQRSGAAGVVRAWLAGAADDRARLADPTAVEPRTARLTRIGGRARRLVPWAVREGERLTHRIDRLWDQVDVLVLPATASLPPSADAITGRGLFSTAWVNARWGPYTGAFNASGHPALVLPAGRTPQGLPVGVQLVGPHGSDARLLALALLLEGQLALGTPRPSLG